MWNKTFKIPYLVYGMRCFISWSIFYWKGLLVLPKCCHIWYILKRSASGEFCNQWDDLIYLLWMLLSGSTAVAPELPTWWLQNPPLGGFQSLIVVKWRVFVIFLKCSLFESETPSEHSFFIICFDFLKNSSMWFWYSPCNNSTFFP